MLLFQRGLLYRYDGKHRQALGSVAFNIVSERKTVAIVNGEERPQQAIRIVTNQELNLYDIIDFNGKEYVVTNIEKKRSGFQNIFAAEMVANG